jgi:hypothetical protein
MNNLQNHLANLIYDTLEGPINDQDARRQAIQWEVSQTIANTVANLVLEQAAQRIDDMPCAPSQQMYDYWSGYRAALNYAAFSIRVMKGNIDAEQHTTDD